MITVVKKFYDVLVANSIDGVCTLSDTELGKIFGVKEGSIRSYLTQLTKSNSIKREVIAPRNNAGQFTSDRIRKIYTLQAPPEKPDKIFCQVGVNDIATTHPQIICFLKDQNDGYKYSHGSEKKVTVKCPICGLEKSMMVIELCNSGFNCPKCSDKVSYPNKFVRAFLEQLPIKNLKFEYKDVWTCNKIYDNYFEYLDQKYVVEVDGNQHKRDTQWSTYEWQKNNDDYKDQLAIDNNYHMIRIPCGRSRDYKIEETILNSEFNKIFDLSNIDWDYCRTKAVTNRTFDICDYVYANPNKKICEIAKHFQVSSQIVSTALKRGRELDKYHGLLYIA